MSIVSSDGITARYRSMMAAGELRPDPDQERLVRRLERLHQELARYPEVSGHGGNLAIASWRVAHLFRLGGTRPEKPRGVYIVGGVGRGKSMLMDMFFEGAPVKAKVRRHFHEFMADVHARLKRWRGYSAKERVAAGGRAGSNDPIPPVAREIASEATLLCFDEFQVTDIADAMVLGRLFEALFKSGVIVVATSNRAPEDLYSDGLNRQLFLPFIKLLTDTLDVEHLDGPTDYRLDRFKGVQTFLTPVNQETSDQMAAAFFKLTDRNVEDRDKVPTGTVEVGGRTIFVPKAARGVAVFSFKRLCGQPLGASDYLAIARRFHTLFLVAVPKLTPDKRNEAKRFVMLIDALYESDVKLLLNAEVPPRELYQSGDGAFEFVRTVSRLEEMQSTDYLRRGHCTRLLEVLDSLQADGEVARALRKETEARREARDLVMGAD